MIVTTWKVRTEYSNILTTNTYNNYYMSVRLHSFNIFYGSLTSVCPIDKSTGGMIQSKPSKQSKPIRHPHQAKPVLAQQSREDSQERRHPFALYGSGEKDADTAGRKTHNVCPMASTHEVNPVLCFALGCVQYFSKVLKVLLFVFLDSRVCVTC